jgi:hypothetical protein
MLTGLENLPSVKVAAERKGAERFVKPEAIRGRREDKLLLAYQYFYLFISHDLKV